MAYSGSTELSSAANPFRHAGGGGLYSGPANLSTDSSGLSTAGGGVQRQQGANIWSICSTNLTTDLNSMSVTDGYELGMRPGDVVIATQFTSHGSSMILSMNLVASVNSTAGTATLSSGAVISSTYS